MTSNQQKSEYINIKTSDNTEELDNDSKTKRASQPTNLELVNLPSETSKTEKHSLLNETSANSISDIPIEKDTPLTQEEEVNNKPNLKGNMIMCCYDKDGNPRICIGPNWPFTLCLTTFISLVCFFYFYGLWNLLNVWVRNIGVAIALIQLGSYMATFLINPGIPSRELWLENFKGEDLNDYRICNICKIVMRAEDETEHCDECNICVVGMDHHCPWTSKCVGKNNLKFFYIFITFTFILMFYLIFALFTLAATA